MTIPCPKCGTMLDEDGYEGVYCTASHRPHHEARCLAIVITQRDETSERLRLAIAALDRAVDTLEMSGLTDMKARAALEKLRGK